jgi:HK97 gp10 family phage protein
MAFKIKARITGLEQIRQRLSMLAVAMQKRILRKAIAAAARVVLREAKLLCPAESGLLRKSLGYTVKVYRGGAVVVAIIGPRMGFKREVVIGNKGAAIMGTKKAEKILAGGGDIETRNPVKYAHFAELGSKHQAARPFLRPALDSTSGAAMAAMEEVIEQGIQDALRSAA